MPTQYEDDKTSNNSNSTDYTKDPEAATEPGYVYTEYEKTPPNDTTDEAYEEPYNKPYETT